METAKEIGIKDIYRSPIDPGEIIDSLINAEGGKKDMLIQEEKPEPERESAVLEQSQPEVFEISQKQESESEIDAILNEIKNILARNKEIYERRLLMQEEMIKQKEEEIKELQKVIEEYKEKEEKKKKVLMELQNLLQ